MQAGLGRRRDQRALGRIALHAPRAVVAVAHEPRVGRERRRAQQFVQRPAVRDRRAFVQERSFRRVADAGHVDHVPVHPDLPRRHLVLRERAGLVRADDRRAAERLHGREAADQRAALHEPLHAQRERNRDDGRQRLGHDGDRERDAEHQHVDERLAAHDTQRDDDDDDRERGAHQRAAEAVEVLLQRRRARLDRRQQAARCGRTRSACRWP